MKWLTSLVVSNWKTFQYQIKFEIEDITRGVHANQMMCQRTISRVEQVVTRLWPQSRVEIFGSYASGLWLPSSDIDLVIVGVNYGARGSIVTLPLYSLISTFDSKQKLDRNLRSFCSQFWNEN